VIYAPATKGKKHPMKTTCTIIVSGLLFCIVIPLYSQTNDKKIFANSTWSSFEKKLPPNLFYTSAMISLRDTLQPLHKDTLPLPHKNYLRNDDPAFNRKYPLLIPILEVPLINGVTWSYDRYVLKAPYANISTTTVKNNFKNGWEWDTDDFPTNFSLHSYTGSLYFNAARSNGYNFYQSAPFALGGSLMWELSMENTKPSYNDLINTTASGIFLGEVLYRLSSAILDDRITGKSRVLREIIGTVIDPVRGVNRVFQGKTSRIVQKEIYQKEPLSFSVTVGARQTNDGANFSTGTTSSILDLNFTYGNPLETRYRKPFDYFRLRADLSFGSTHIANNVIGAGFLFGGNMDSTRKMKMLTGGFQHYDYWNTDSFEIGTIGLGGGMIMQLPVSKKSNFKNELHFAVVPLGASNERRLAAPDTATNPHFKNYSYSRRSRDEIFNSF